MNRKPILNPELPKNTSNDRTQLMDKPDATSQTISETSSETTSAKLILALDFGVKKMGMAMGNTLTQDARPFDIMPMDNGQPDWSKLVSLIAQWQIQVVVVGLPLNMDGSESMLAKRASKFSRRLQHQLQAAHLPVTVCLHDERLSSREARNLAWEQGLIQNPTEAIDDLSACLLLNSYLLSQSE